ncbi:GNAT family N-acetyltransferase [Pseudomonas sp. Marseille-QA0892]
MRIRKGQASDCETITRFVQDARLQMFGDRIDPSAIPGDMRHFDQTYCEGSGCFLIAEDSAGTLNGCIAWRAYDHRFPSLDYSGQAVVEVVRLFVAPAMRRRGLGSALFRALRAEAQEACIDVLYLHTHPFLAGAVQFWERQGFRTRTVDEDPVWRTIHMDAEL